jgi:hypothetical protein
MEARYSARCSQQAMTGREGRAAELITAGRRNLPVPEDQSVRSPAPEP